MVGLSGIVASQVVALQRRAGNGWQRLDSYDTSTRAFFKLRRFARKYIDFKGMPLSEVVDRIAESRAVIDVNRPGQLGLTMRTIEAIGAQRLLVTTNEDIVNYEVYSQKGMYLIDRRAPKVAREFLQGEGIPHAESVRVGLSARNWVLRVLGN